MTDPTGHDEREYEIVVSAFGLDGAAEDRLFDRVATAAHECDEQVTVHGRTPRPLTISEEAIEAAARHMHRIGPWGWYTAWDDLDADTREGWLIDAEHVLHAALPHLAGGQADTIEWVEAGDDQ